MQDLTFFKNVDIEKLSLELKQFGVTKISSDKNNNVVVYNVKEENVLSVGKVIDEHNPTLSSEYAKLLTPEDKINYIAKLLRLI